MALRETLAPPRPRPNRQRLNYGTILIRRLLACANESSISLAVRDSVTLQCALLSVGRSVQLVDDELRAYVIRGGAVRRRDRTYAGSWRSVAGP